MTARLSLALAIHDHQPVGNFGWIYAEAYRRAYEPFLAALERHPRIRLALHYTGPLLEWIRAEQPDFLLRLVALQDRDQVELMGGGWDEPILVSLPERDRVGQLRHMADELERFSGRRPRGAWLAERVWEPSLPSTLADAGYAWTIVDDVHFRAASIPADRALGPYSSDDQGRRVNVFATDQRLRYSIPFGDSEKVLEYLSGLASEDEPCLATMGDDGEKFGSWPGTYEHCWGKDRWVERFFEALEGAADWLTTTTPSDWLADHAPLGRAYIPTASYIEMTEWALPPEESIAFHDALARAVEADAPEARWLRGGFWRTYQARYREINDMHKAMLRVSDRVAAMPDGPSKARAVAHLYQGQSNDTYWHGVFGGVYITHLRLATWEHLIAAEDLAAGSEGTALERPGPSARAREAMVPRAELTDVDLDGRDEALLEEVGQLVTVHLGEGGGIGEWDLRAPRHALAAVLRRRPEASHLRILAAERAREEAQAALEAREAELDETNDAPPATIHDRVTAKEEGLAAKLDYDWHERRSALVHFVAADVTQADFAAARYVDEGDFVDRPFEPIILEPGMLRIRRQGSIRAGEVERPLVVEKVIRLGSGRSDPALAIDVVVENPGPERVDSTVALEWALNLLGGGGNRQAWYLVDGKRTRHDGTGSREGAASVGFGNDHLGIAVEATAEPPASVWWHPIETVSSSEGGFERIYQGSALVFRWPLALDGGAVARYAVRMTARCGRDRRAEETSIASQPGA